MTLNQTLPILATPYDVPRDKIAAFRCDGRVRLDGVLPLPDLAPFRDAISSHTIGFASGLAPLEQRDTYG